MVMTLGEMMNEPKLASVESAPMRLSRGNQLLLWGLLMLVVLLSIAQIGDWSSAALQYWWTDSISYPGFLDTNVEHIRNIMTAIHLTLVPVIYVLAITTLVMGLVEVRVVSLMDSALAMCVFMFAGSYLIFQAFFASHGMLLGQEALGIYSGSTYCLVVFFVVYRFYEARDKDHSIYHPMFRAQLIVIGLSPWLFQVAYGLWFLCFGSLFNGSYLQQLLVSLGHFLLPLMILYLFYGARSVLERSSLNMVSVILIIVSMGLLVLGTIGYREAVFKPAIL